MSESKTNQDSMLEVCDLILEDGKASPYLREIISLIKEDSLGYGPAIFSFITHLGRYNQDFAIIMILSWLGDNAFLSALEDEDEISH